MSQWPRRGSPCPLHWQGRQPPEPVALPKLPGRHRSQCSPHVQSVESQQAGHKVRSKNRKRPRPPDSVDHRAPPKLLRRVKQALGQERESKPQQRGRRSRYRDGTGAGAGAWVTALPEGSLREEEARVLEKKRSPHKAGTEAQSTWLTLALITVAGSPPAAVAMKAAATVPRATRGRGSWGRRGWGQV